MMKACIFLLDEYGSPQGPPKTRHLAVPKKLPLAPPPPPPPSAPALTYFDNEDAIKPTIGSFYPVKSQVGETNDISLNIH